MARILQLVDEIALSHAPHAVGAAGHIDVHPNSRNVIPGKVVFTVDFRSPRYRSSKTWNASSRKAGRKFAKAWG